MKWLHWIESIWGRFLQNEWDAFRWFESRSYQGNINEYASFRMQGVNGTYDSRGIVFPWMSCDCIWLPARWAHGLLWWPRTAINNVVFCLVKSLSLFLYCLFEIKFTTTTCPMSNFKIFSGVFSCIAPAYNYFPQSSLIDLNIYSRHTKNPPWLYLGSWLILAPKPVGWTMRSIPVMDILSQEIH